MPDRRAFLGLSCAFAAFAIALLLRGIEERAARELVVSDCPKLRCDANAGGYCDDCSDSGDGGGVSCQSHADLGLCVPTTQSKECVGTLQYCGKFIFWGDYNGGNCILPGMTNIRCDLVDCYTATC